MSRIDWAGSVSEISPPLFSLQKFRCVHMRRRAGHVTEISVTELEIFPLMNTPARTSTGTFRDETFSTAHGL